MPVSSGTRPHRPGGPRTWKPNVADDAPVFAVMADLLYQTYERYTLDGNAWRSDPTEDHEIALEQASHDMRAVLTVGEMLFGMTHGLDLSQAMLDRVRVHHPDWFHEKGADNDAHHAGGVSE